MDEALLSGQNTCDGQRQHWNPTAVNGVTRDAPHPRRTADHCILLCEVRDPAADDIVQPPNRCQRPDPHRQPWTRAITAVTHGNQTHLPDRQ